MSSEIAAKQGPVFKNTLILVGAQLLGAPLTILINAAMGRYLGAGNLGDAYLASTLIGFGFLFVEWGHSGVLPAAVAQNRSRAGVLLGSSIVWRLLTSLGVTALLALGSWLFGYSVHFELVLLLVALQWLISSVSSACQDVVRGFERTDVSAFAKVGAQLLTLLFVVPTLLAGGGLVAVLAVQAATQVVILIMVWRATLRVGEIKVAASWAETHGLRRAGNAFLVFSFAMTLQGNVDAIFLSKLTSQEVVGWHAAAQRLSGTLNIPATALVAALYPTLARLVTEDMAAFRHTAQQALRGTAVLAVPLALCCGIYREVGIDLYSEKNFGPAGQNLLILSGLLFLVYFSMPLGTAIVAAGRQRAWAVAQASCVIVSLVCDPILIPWFQRRYGNGGLGVCTGAVISEVFMVTTAMFLAPAGIMDWSVGKAVGKAMLSGLAMCAVAYLLRSFSPFLAAPVAVTTYFVALWLVKGIDPAQLQSIKERVLGRLKRSKG